MCVKYAEYANIANMQKLQIGLKSSIANRAYQFILKWNFFKN